MHTSRFSGPGAGAEADDQIDSPPIAARGDAVSSCDARQRGRATALRTPWICRLPRVSGARDLPRPGNRNFTDVMIDDDRLLQQFEDRSYPFDQWHHRAHVRVAWIYLKRFGL